MPRPISSNGMVTIAASAFGSRARISTRVPASIASTPSRTTRRGDARGKNLGMPTAPASSAMDKGRMRTPVSSADSPSATERNSGMVKNTPACTRYCTKNMVSPAFISR